MDPKLRHFVEDQLQEFRRTDQSTHCAMCRTELTSGYHVDHVTPFKQLVTEYNAIYGQRTPDDNYVYYAGWIHYHRYHSVLRKTCRTCNLTRPKWTPTKATCAICNQLERLNEDGICTPCDNRYT